MKKKLNITQTSSGKYMTLVSEGHGNNRRKAKITADTPEDVIVKATKWLRNIEEEKTFHSRLRRR